MSDWLATHSTDSANHGLDVWSSITLDNLDVLMMRTDDYARPHNYWNSQVNSGSSFYNTTISFGFTATLETV
jgi:hypothetical protein